MFSEKSQILIIFLHFPIVTLWHKKLCGENDRCLKFATGIRKTLLFLIMPYVAVHATF